MQQAAEFLPDCRAYVKVSPHDKGGANILSLSATSASTDGGRILYTSYGIFAGNSAGAFPSYYIGAREEAGWTARGVSPPQMVSTLAPNLVRAASNDLNRLLVYTNEDLTGDVPRGTWGVYIHDLNADQYQFVTSDVSAQLPAGSALLPAFRSSSSGMETILFSSNTALTPDAPATGSKTYAWKEGQLQLGSINHLGDPITGHPGDGVGDSRNPVSSDGTVYFFEGVGTGLYRVEDGISLPINASENAGESISLGTATFRGASADGSKAFFTSNQRLVDEDIDTAQDLYLYDHEAPAGSRLTLISIDGEPADTGAVQGVLNISDDASIAYFASNEQLVEGEPTAPPIKLYAWVSGELRYIGGTVSTQLERYMWNPADGMVHLRQNRAVSDNGRTLLMRTASVHPPFDGD